MAGVWMGFMLIVLAFWAFWLNQKEELLHPRSEQRARASLFLVIGIAVISLVVCLSIQVAA